MQTSSLKIEVKVPVPVDQPVVPERIDNEVKKKTNLWGWLTTISGSGGVGLAGLLGPTGSPSSPLADCLSAALSS